MASCGKLSANCGSLMVTNKLKLNEETLTKELHDALSDEERQRLANELARAKAEVVNKTLIGPLPREIWRIRSHLPKLLELLNDLRHE
eukprot:6413428-Pyramimonas_sp.AAC.1